MRGALCFPVVGVVLVVLAIRSLAVGQESSSTQLIDEMNVARGNPSAYAERLKTQEEHFRGNVFELPGTPGFRTMEGRVAVEEAVRVLKHTSPLPPLTLSTGLTRAARWMVEQQGARGKTGHVDLAGTRLEQRIDREGTWDGQIAENLSYGFEDARIVVEQLIIDDGVASRGHRHNILNPEFRFAGGACGPHSVYRTMCAIEFASGFRERK